VPRRRGEITLAEVATRLEIHPQTVRRYTLERRPGYPRLRGKKRGNAWLYRDEDVAAFEREWRTDGDAEAVAS